MRRRRRATIEELRQTIDCMPVGTRTAMLEGIRCNEIIVGAYADRDGGVCPMLAAHRAGGRTSLIGFARVWDRFAQPGSRARHATGRELLILTTQLEASLLEEEEASSGELSLAVAEHLELLARRRRELQIAVGEEQIHAARLQGSSDREGGHELRLLPGSSWMRVLSRHRDCDRTLERALASDRDREQAQAQARRSPPTAEPAAR